MKRICFLLLISTSIITAQVGINTTDPKGILDVTSSDLGLVVPRVPSVENLTDGDGNDPINATIVYDISRKSLCYKVNNRWVCISTDNSGRPISQAVTEDYSQVSNYIKASNTNAQDTFGQVAISGDGSRMVVGASREDSFATGVNGNQTDNSSTDSGAAYIFRNDSGVWTQEAYIKASNTGAGDRFGVSLDMDERGIRVFIGATGEDSSATGVNGNQSNNSETNSGAVYVFRRSGTTWTQEAYIKASNTGANDLFGGDIAVNDPGSVLAISAGREDGNATGINGNQNDNSATDAGAVYVFRRTGTTWAQQAYIKASNTEANDLFGVRGLALSGDGKRLAVGAQWEDSAATGVDGDQSDNSVTNSGAVYLFGNNGSDWYQEAYLKAPVTTADLGFGSCISLSRDGTAMAVTASDSSNSRGINGNPNGTGAVDSGAVYIFKKQGFEWTTDCYIKSSNSDANDIFGYSLALDDSGTVLAVGAFQEDSSATNLNGNENDNSSADSGAVYLFKNNGNSWSQTSYIKSSNTDDVDRFGTYISLTNDGTILAVGAHREDSNATGIGGDQSNNAATDSGAVYIIE